MSVEIAALAFTVFVAFVSGGAALWRMMVDKIKESSEDAAAKVASAKAEVDKDIARLELGQKNAVSREEFMNSQIRTDKLLESVSLAIRAGNDTLTSRIDSVLFEIGRRDKNGSNS